MLIKFCMARVGHAVGVGKRFHLYDRYFLSDWKIENHLRKSLSHRAQNMRSFYEILATIIGVVEFIYLAFKILNHWKYLNS